MLFSIFQFCLIRFGLITSLLFFVVKNNDFYKISEFKWSKGRIYIPCILYIIISDKFMLMGVFKLPYNE